MAIYVYNTKQQALNSKKIAELFSFSSNDFGGLVSNEINPIVLNEEELKWSWAESLQNTQATFIGGGVDIGYDVPTTEFTFPDDEYCYLWGLDIVIPSSTSSIETDKYNDNSAKINRITCSNISIDSLYIIVKYPSGNPHDKNYYEYDEGTYELSADTTVQDDKIYYYKLDNEAFKIENAEFSNIEQRLTFDYYGNTIWIEEGRFFIPFCGKDSEGNLFSIIFNRDKTGYESFLTARTYYHLLAELGNEFVFRVGGPTKGDIGDLNITDNYITNKTNANNGVKIDNLVLTNITPVTNVDNILVMGEDGKIYKTNSETYIIPIKHGGTSANIENQARNNLGFTFGTGDPPNDAPKRFNGDIDEGAVYFKLL